MFSQQLGGNKLPLLRNHLRMSLNFLIATLVNLLDFKLQITNLKPYSKKKFTMDPTAAELGF